MSIIKFLIELVLKKAATNNALQMTEEVSEEPGVRLLSAKRRVCRELKEPMLFQGQKYMPGIYWVEQSWDKDLVYHNAQFGIGGGYYKSGWRLSAIIKKEL